MDYLPIIHTITGPLPGPRIAVIAGVHGDEPVGVKALEKILPNLVLERGTLVAVIANPKALVANKRFLEANLNRSLIPNPPENTLEGKIAPILMQILDTVVAALDIHAGMGGEPPFVICEENSFPIAERMPVSIVSTGWVTAEPGSTDEYMFRQGKPALCIECGNKWDFEAMTPVAETAIWQFLNYFQMIKPISPTTEHQRFIGVHYSVFKKTADFSFTRKYKGFDVLQPGELIATDGIERYVAPAYPSCIIFPWAEAPVGTEAFIIAENFN